MDRRFFLMGGSALALSACGASKEDLNATPEQISKAVYRHNGPPALTLYTMVNNRSKSGAHTSLMINASQRVIFDPAGSVRHTLLPERNDVLYGVTPRVQDFYERAHARVTYHALVQRKEVPAEVAEKALALVQSAGPVPQGQCASSTARVLQQLPGFESIRVGLFPNKLAEQFGALPGVTERRVYDDDEDDKTGAINAFGQTAAAEN